jgi:LacI family transcriptional regulator
MPATLRHVALIVNLNKAYDRSIVEGVTDYARGRTNWSVYFEDEPQTKLPSLAAWRGDGVIADLDDPIVTRVVRRLGIPVVGVGGGGGGAAKTHFPYVDTDNRLIARLAAEHLLERGFRKFAYCGLPPTPTNPWSRFRELAFVEHVREAGHDCSVYRGRHLSARRWESVQRGLTKWLLSLERPVGLMTCEDVRARHVLEACRRAGLRVPEDVAVIGVDNDVLFCELATPPLSSVIQDTRGIGYEAARTLDAWMSGRRPKVRWREIPPLGVAARQSTDVTAIDDQQVAAAVQFIRRRAAERVGVQDVLKHVGLSRTALDQRFRERLGRTIHAELDRVRIQTARNLLATTDLLLDAVAKRSGFSNAQYMSLVFRKQLGRSPGSLRGTKQEVS